MTREDAEVLNDLAWPTRALVAAMGLAVGVMLGGPVAGAASGLGFALVVGGTMLELVVLVAFPVFLGRADRRFRALAAVASAEIATGAVVPVPAVGRVVRRRIATLPWWLPGRGGGTGASLLVVLTAVGDGPPRRVAAIVPADLGLQMRHVPAELLVHPHHREVAVVDDRVTRERLAAIDTDPRWHGERLPSDRTVVGGYLALLAAFAAGVVAGVGVGALVVTLAT